MQGRIRGGDWGVAPVSSPCPVQPTQIFDDDFDDVCRFTVFFLLEHQNLRIH